MSKINIGNISIDVDVVTTKLFYEKQFLFWCDCKDCLNYVSKIEEVKNSFNGLDIKLGIDLTKDVGQGMDELMPHDYKDHHLYVIPYYIAGKCYKNGVELNVNASSDTWYHDNRAEFPLSKDLSIVIVNSTGTVEFKSNHILTIWVEFKTPLIGE